MPTKEDWKDYELWLSETEEAEEYEMRLEAHVKKEREDVRD